MKFDIRNKYTKVMIVSFLLLMVLQAFMGSISLKALFNLTALEIIFAGIFLSIIISFSFDTLVDTVNIIRASFAETVDYESDIHKLHKLAVKVKREGILSIQQEIEQEKDTFMRDAMILLNDYKKPNVIRDVLEKDIESRQASLYKPYNVLKMIAHVAPSFGLIGTLIGLIGLLSNINETNLIMHNMASALVSTLYGSLLANLFVTPLMGRIKEKYIDKHILRYKMIVEGIVLISQNESARDVFDKMNVMLKEDQRLQYPRRVYNERIIEGYEFEA